MRRSPTLFFFIFFVCVLLVFLVYVPWQAGRLYGPPAASLTPGHQWQYSLRLLWHDRLLTVPVNLAGPPQSFSVADGEPAFLVGRRLEQAGLIRDTDAFLDYLVYTGLDVSLQAGDYELSPAQSTIDIARAMQDATPLEVTFVVLPGWRMEEIAASLSTSGLDATSEEFLESARDPLNYAFMSGASTNEGFFLPDTYILPRATDADGLVQALVRNFALHLTEDLETGFSDRGLTVYQAVTLASLVERESIRPEEMPIIASVFLNRLSAGWKLDSDPTVQYAIGRAPDWWPNPLSSADLDFDSPYNTYLYPGLPPAPIANPSLEALRAVANPAETSYYFFRARCDGSGYHNFSTTLEEHIDYGCP